VSIVVRYPGRACLLGEHCDWAGGSSLALPIPLAIRVEAEPASQGIRAQSTLHGELLEGRWPLTGDRSPRRGPLRFIGGAAHLLSERYQPPAPCLLRVESTLPAGRGFSSSAAFCLAVLDSLARTSGTILEAEELAELAYQLEHDLLGVACGRLDPLACVAGAPVFLRWTEGRSPLVRLTPGAPMELVLGSFSTPRDTPGILSTLQAHAADQPSDALDPRACRATRIAIRVFDTQAQAGALALEQGKTGELGEAMNRVQEAYEEHLEPHLEPLRAPGLREAVRRLRDAGALGAKFSGAGGDGSVIALFDDATPAERACELLEGSGLRAWRMSLGSQ
jgi:mevalonate kinase